MFSCESYPCMSIESFDHQFHDGHVRIGFTERVEDLARESAGPDFTRDDGLFVRRERREGISGRIIGCAASLRSCLAR